MNIVVRGVHLFAGEETEAVFQIFPVFDGAEGRGVAVVVGHGNEIKSFFAVTGGNVFGSLAPVGTDGVQMNVPAVRAQSHEIRLEGIDIEMNIDFIAREPFGRLFPCGEFADVQSDVVFLFTRAENAEIESSVADFRRADRVFFAFGRMIPGFVEPVDRMIDDFDVFNRRQLRVSGARCDADFRDLIGGDNARENVEIIRKRFHFILLFLKCRFSFT